MKIYKLKKTQLVNTTLEEAWDFFSSPMNLAKITPTYMGFEVLSEEANQKMYEGMIIEYIVKPVLGIPTRWLTEITHVRDKNYFVDEQRVGPYKLWHHQHLFEQREGKVEMTDIIHYALPFGIFGKIGHTIFVKKQLNSIFDYRTEYVEKMFNS